MTSLQATFSKWRKQVALLPLLGYLLLALVTGIAFQQAADAREKIASETRAVLIQTCERNNDLRGSLIGILRSSEKNLEVQLKEGLITEAEATRSRTFYKEGMRNLRQLDCVKLYPKPKPR